MTYIPSENKKFNFFKYYYTMRLVKNSFMREKKNKFFAFFFLVFVLAAKIF